MKKILFVEDDEPLVRMYNRKLTAAGFIVDNALDGEIALDKLEKNDYDLILLDIMLPKIDGFTVLKNLRCSEWLACDKPVIMLSNLEATTDIDYSLNLGANDYLMKANYTPSQVVEKIQEALK